MLWRWMAVSCLAIGPQAHAGEGERLTLDQLPPGVVKSVKESFRAEPQHARKTVEGDKARYTVTALHNGEVIEIFASPDGAALARKTEEISLTRWPVELTEAALVIVSLGMIVGALTRGWVRAVRGQPLSAPTGWLSAWAGTGIVMALVVFNMATVPREKDVVMLSMICVVWAAITASLVEVIALAWRTEASRGDRVSRRWWMIGCFAVMMVSLALWIPLENLRIERENRIYEKLTLRPAAN